MNQDWLNCLLQIPQNNYSSDVVYDEGRTKIGHVGIYIGGNRFIHAANPSKGVVEESLSNSYYDQRYVKARRILRKCSYPFCFVNTKISDVTIKKNKKSLKQEA